MTVENWEYKWNDYKKKPEQKRPRIKRITSDPCWMRRTKTIQQMSFLWENDKAHQNALLLFITKVFADDCWCSEFLVNFFFHFSAFVRMYIFSECKPLNKLSMDDCFIFIIVLMCFFFSLSLLIVWHPKYKHFPKLKTKTWWKCTEKKPFHCEQS